MTNTELSPQLFKELSAIAFRVAMGILRDHDRALDIAQEVLLSAHCKLPDLKNPDRMAAYVARGAYNRSLNAQRNAASRRTKLEGVIPMNPSQSEHLPGERAQQRAIVADALDRLADRQGEALKLRFFQGLKVREIALVMAISEGAVKTHLARGLTNLKSLLEDLEGLL
jgi:RNA polymerase sigma factor (sigma-70 family)